MKTAEELWQAVRQASPMVHAVSNVVTANDCANLLLAVGARPIMAQAPAEAAEITAACRATVLNLGTPNDEKFAACRAAGQEANRLGHPVVLDPVGVGASAYRRRETQALLGAVHPQERCGHCYRRIHKTGVWTARCISGSRNGRWRGSWRGGSGVWCCLPAKWIL